MGRVYKHIEAPVRRFIEEQPMFFVATAPMAEQGHVNLSPKGMDTLRVINPDTIAYVDLVGSGAETIAHLRENGRITFMWCSFGPKPRIVRAYGQGTHLVPGSNRFGELMEAFPAHRAVRSMIRVRVTRVADSCGFGVPEMNLVGQRGKLAEWGDDRTAEELETYKRERNAVSIDGLPAWEG
jgi:hypothetical protein